MSATLPSAGLQFTVASDRVPVTPPERRGIARDGVRLLVARPGSLDHRRFRDLAEVLGPGDVLVVNTSATRPAAVGGIRGGQPVIVHLATQRPDGGWVVELRRPDGEGPVLDGHPGDAVVIDGGGVVRLDREVATGPEGNGVRLWRATVEVATTPQAHMRAHGRPITYGLDAIDLPLADHQTVFADLADAEAQDLGPDQPSGSAEMASAGRPFTTGLVTRLVSRGVMVVPVTLHAGVSSQEAGEPPQPEWMDVPTATAQIVSAARRHGHRVIAVGTTVTRALESAAATDGVVRPMTGWTDLVLGPDRPTRVVDGLITGWHEADASHLLLLQAVAGRSLVARAYQAAVAGRYLWHGFGDSCLLLP